MLIDLEKVCEKLKKFLLASRTRRLGKDFEGQKGDKK